MTQSTYSPALDDDPLMTAPARPAPAPDAWGGAQAALAAGETTRMQEPMTITMDTGAVSAAGLDGSTAAGPVSTAGTAVATEGAPVAATRGPVSTVGLAGWLDGSDDTDAGHPAPVAERPQGSDRLRFWLGIAFFFGGLMVGGIGFYLSFGNLTVAAHEKFGFAPGESSILFALGVDATIVVCLIGDLLFAARGHSFWLLRPVAHAFTALTIYLNATAHDTLREAVPHAAMPIVFVVLVEAGRHYLIQVTELEMGIGRDPIPRHRWILHPFQTGGIFRTMKTWEMTYTQVRTQRRELAVYRVWLDHRAEIEKGLEAGQLGVLDRLPVLLAPHGVSVNEALTLPARMRRAEQHRTQKQEREALDLKADAERHARDLEHQAELEATAAEAQRLKATGELAQLRARVTGQEKVALAEAEGATAAAELEAQTTLAAARRVATQEERRTAQEDAAEETARTAEAKSRAAAALAATAESERKAAEEAARIADARAAQERGKAEEERQKLAAQKAATETVELRRTAAETAKLAAADELSAAETARLAAETRAQVAHAEALADLTPVQIKTRVAARVLLANPAADGAEIAAALGGASPSTASTYRKAALDLIAQGYPETDPDLTGTPATAPVTIPGQTEITV
ncbi:DUF2637 domain-containing protein [Streptomyces sp. NPDC058394]|uniref:DUF2637 domain-containing protein n=1 Tax=Streptomyces sp. NPDC058394 TaxID=3346477 RepID=UPI003650A77A